MFSFLFRTFVRNTFHSNKYLESYSEICAEMCVYLHQLMQSLHEISVLGHQAHLIKV